MSDDFEDEACEFLNEAECEERLDDRGVDMNDASNKHFREFDEGR
jgi:hypothetical protein